MQSYVRIEIQAKNNGLSFTEEVKMIEYQEFQLRTESLSETSKFHRQYLLNASWREGSCLECGAGEGCREGDTEGTVLRAEECSDLAGDHIYVLSPRGCRRGHVRRNVLDGGRMPAPPQASKHQILVGCEMDEECFGNAKKRVLRHVSSFLEESTLDVTVDLCLMDPARIVNYSVPQKEVEDRSWQPPPGLSRYQSVLIHDIGALAS